MAYQELRNAVSFYYGEDHAAADAMIDIAGQMRKTADVLAALNSFLDEDDMEDAGLSDLFGAADASLSEAIREWAKRNFRRELHAARGAPGAAAA